MTTNTDSLPLSQQQGIRQKQLQSQKNQALDIGVDETSGKKKSRKRRRTYEPIGLNIEPNHKQTKNIGADFIPLNHSWRTNHEAQVNVSKSFEKDILCMVDVTKVQRY